MNKQELFEYLQENLQVKIDISSSGRVEVFLLLEEKEISYALDYIEGLND